MQEWFTGHSCSKFLPDVPTYGEESFRKDVYRPDIIHDQDNACMEVKADDRQTDLTERSSKSRHLVKLHKHQIGDKKGQQNFMRPDKRWRRKLQPRALLCQLVSSLRTENRCRRKCCLVFVTDGNGVSVPDIRRNNKKSSIMSSGTRFTDIQLSCQLLLMSRGIGHLAISTYYLLTATTFARNKLQHEGTAMNASVIALQVFFGPDQLDRRFCGPDAVI
ncbi:hypothetical protein M9H77_25981 [Catharanthus roseus]|uniref:Uncharacterized protein n=1 Tax=Catharanthus roseus TaxID=4058 RepID=A0ACC0ACN1_CATRO|nr:hypothetical protein M9H77_25981 [Catharanthus roseus]